MLDSEIRPCDLVDAIRFLLKVVLGSNRMVESVMAGLILCLYRY